MNDLGMGDPGLKRICKNPQLRQLIGPVPVGASEVFSNNSGRFCKFDNSRRLEVAGSGDGNLFGWVDDVVTASSTEGATKVYVDVNPMSLFWIPADDTVTAAMRGLTCDLVVASNIQRADVGESNEDVIWIQDVDIANQLVLVKMASATIYQAGIA